MSRSDSRQHKVELSPLVRRIIELAYYAENDDSSSFRAGEADFFAAAAILAAKHVGVRGFLAPHPDLYAPIEELARQHLGWVEATDAFRKALERVGDPDSIDAIESAHGRIIAASDTAYYYVGLAFGLTLADLKPS